VIQNFRFYDRFNSLMVYSSEYESLADFFEDYEKAVKGENAPVLIQSTGLNDKNGKEIFEGDLIKGKFGDIMSVLWDDGFASFCLSKPGWAYLHYFKEAVDAEKCEVIGNIYDNKELLNEKD